MVHVDKSTPRNLVLALVLASAAGSCLALTVDAKALARFDVGYTRCEAQYPEMRGHRDDAWLSLRRVKADEALRKQLATVRKGGIYQSERRQALKPAAQSAASAASSPLAHQCQALWAETRRVMTAKR